jgi:hypothetical protein
MPIRNSPRAIEDLSDLNRLDELVVDKRLGKRASAKKNRRNRHYEKQFIRNSLTHHLELDPTNASDRGEPKDKPDEIDLALSPKPRN